MDEHAEREREERAENEDEDEDEDDSGPPAPPPSPRTPLPDEGGAAEGGSRKRKVEEPDAHESIEVWSTGVEQPDALPALRRRLHGNGRVVAAHYFLNRYDLSRVEGWTPENGHVFKAKVLLSLKGAGEPPFELSTSKYSGLRGADVLWHAFIETPQYAAEFGLALGYVGGLPHTQGSASLEHVVDLEVRLTGAYRRAFRKRLIIPEPEVPLPDEYAELLEEDEVVCG